MGMGRGYICACMCLCVCTKESTWVKEGWEKGGSEGQGRRCGYKFKSIHRIQNKNKIMFFFLLLLPIVCGGFVTQLLYKTQSAVRLACDSSHLKGSTF